MTIDIETRRRRAAYRAHHRGTKEMDWLVGRYADARLDGFDAAALTRFERFLEIADPELQRWLLAPELASGGEFGDLVRDVRAFHGLADEPGV
ncbi:MAG: succinate dehydrogenase assembly factor 2 [Hyphomicrobiaceae bacterium]